MRYHNIFFSILKLYLWSIHVANKFILAISSSFKLNSNLNFKKYVFPPEIDLYTQNWLWPIWGQKGELIHWMIYSNLFNFYPDNRTVSFEFF